MLPLGKARPKSMKCPKICVILCWQPIRGARGGGPHPRGPPAHVGMGIRGVGARGRGPRPGAGSLRGGRGGPPFKGQPNQPRGGKRKAGNDLSQGVTKRRNTQDGNWGNQPIAQQPLDQSGYGSGGYDYTGNDAQWYQDSFGQNWGWNSCTQHGPKLLLLKKTDFIYRNLAKFSQGLVWKFAKSLSWVLLASQNHGFCNFTLWNFVRNKIVLNCSILYYYKCVT